MPAPLISPPATSHPLQLYLSPSASCNCTHPQTHARARTHTHSNATPAEAPCLLQHSCNTTCRIAAPDLQHQHHCRRGEGVAPAVAPDVACEVAAPVGGLPPPLPLHAAAAGRDSHEAATSPHRLSRRYLTKHIYKARTNSLSHSNPLTTIFPLPFPHPHSVSPSPSRAY
jgi:hypothetical protein